MFTIAAVISVFLVNAIHDAVISEFEVDTVHDAVFSGLRLTPFTMLFFQV